MIRMVRKTISSLLGVALILLMVTLLSYSLMYLSPGDPAETILRAGGAMPSEADIIAKRHEMGLDRPFHEQYARWLGNFLRGDLGDSMVDGTNVSKELFKGLKASALLAVLSLGVGVVIAIPAGIFSAVRRNGLFDRISYEPLKPYYAFYAFSDLAELGTEVKATAEGEGIYALAAKSEDGKRGALLLTNYRNEMTLDGKEFPPEP